LTTEDTSDLRHQLQGAVEEAEKDVERRRLANAELAEAFRAEPNDDGKELLKRGAASLVAARERVDAAKAALAVFEKTGSPHGLVSGDGRVFGSVAVELAPGTPRAAREAAIDAALGEALIAAAAELGVVLGTSPARYTRERPGRDAAGRTVLDVQGRVEGDVLVPALRPVDKYGR
jgi:hypothetical protein